MVPATMAMMLGLFPAILMALGVVREKELGSITNLYVTPVTRIEFLIGKQLPYIAVAMANFTLMFLMALFVFQVPLKGSFPTLLLGVLIYVTTMTAYGMLISAFTNTQIAALFGTSILTVLPATQFAGMMTPVSSLAGSAQLMGRAFPMTYFVPISVGTFTKGLGFADLGGEPGGSGGFRPDSDSAERSAAAQAGTLGGARPMRKASNIFWLGVKELRSFLRDYVLLGLVVYAFSFAVTMQARSFSQELHNASIAFVDEDHSELSRRIAHAFLPPLFQAPHEIAERDIVPLMNAGRYTFVIDIPPNFQRDVLGGRRPGLQIDVDATAMVQAGLGSGYAQQIITTEIADFLSNSEGAPLSTVNLDVRIAFNPNITTAWFTSVMGIINSISMLAIILSGAAIVREREHGTMDHLLVMPLTPFEIAMSKVWANGLVITVAVGLSLYVVVRTVLGIPIAGSIPLFMVGVVIYLFFATAIGIFLGTVARSMPQLGLLYMLVYLPMNMLSGANTPLESMPPWLATVMQASPSTHFVSFAQSILYRGAGIDVVWRQFVLVALIGGLFFWLAILRFRSVAAQAT